MRVPVPVPVMLSERLVEMSCERPAEIFNLVGKGKVEVGADADLVMFREGVTTQFTHQMVTAHCGWSPYVGREVGVPPDLVVVQGRVVAESGQLRDDLRCGQQVQYNHG